MASKLAIQTKQSTAFIIKAVIDVRWFQKMLTSAKKVLVYKWLFVN